jgi:cytoskeletal protein CcmA (bactofilin family)
MVVKGELTGSEDLIVDGQVEGRIQLSDHTLTIGPEAHIQADVVAKIVTVLGAVAGHITAGHQIEIRRGGSVEGNLQCARVLIQDGAYFCGRVDMGSRLAMSPAPENAREINPDSSHSQGVLGEPI